MLNTLASLKVPRYEQVRWYIKKLLIEKQWHKDKPLPTEQALAAECQVSIGTVRKAVDRLVEEGILIKQQGRGTFLKHPNFDSSLSRFFKFRNSHITQLLPIGIVKSVQSIAAVTDINEKLKLLPEDKLIYIERIRQLEEKTILSEKIWLAEKVFNPLLAFKTEEFGNLLYPFYYEHCHQFVFSATEQLFFIKCYQDAYLNNLPNESIVKICRIAKDMLGNPIEYRESYGLAENFSYEITLN